MDKSDVAHLATEGKKADEWSNFLCFVDASVMVKDVEDHIIEIEKKKKKKTRSYSQLNHESLDGASTSSSLLDLNEVPTDSYTREGYRRFISSSEAKTPQNPDEERRAKKGKSKIVSEEKKTFFDYVPRKIRSAVRYPVFENLNGASTSSSSPETKTPPYPNYKSSSSSCLTESTSSTKLAVSGGKSKKTKIDSREAPEWILEVVRDMNGVGKPELIFETELSASDVNQGQSRLLIPFNKLPGSDFLNDAEREALEKEAPNRENDNFGVGTILVNQKSQKFGLRIKKYEMKKDSGHGTFNYALNYDWNYVVEKNNLKERSKISLWTFRCCGILWFALEKR